MGLISAALRRTGTISEVRGANPQLPWGDTTPPTNGMLAMPVAGTSINEKSAQAISAVATAVSILSDAVATLPIRQYVGTGPEKVEVELTPVVAQPWSEVSRLDFIDQVVRSMALRGNAWGQVVQRDRRGYPTQVILIHPDQIHVRRDAVNGQMIVMAGQVEIEPDDVFHIPYHMSPGSLIGLNPIEVHRNTLGLARAADLSAGSFFANSSRPDGVLKVNSDLDEDEARLLAQKWMQSHQGIGNAHMPAVLTGDVEWQQISISPKDAQFLETRQYSRSEIFSLFRIPPHMGGDVDRTTSWGTGIEQQEIGFVRNTLMGYLRRIEDAFTALTPRGNYVKFDLTNRLRGDTLQRWQAYAVARTLGAITIDDVRIAEDMPPFGTEWSTNPMAPLNSAQNGSLVSPGEAAPNPMGADKAAQKSPSGQ